ncbi:MAG: PilZ domain-containing protein [Elusimicrobia bacterium]|nr:PilZ domain-containing protein [Elusimicrobiota bacterium]
MDNRRRHPRIRKDAPLILIEKGSGKGEGAQLRDVSLGGLAFETRLQLRQGSTFGFALYVPSQGWVDGRGRVCWAKPSGKGWICGASITIERAGQQRLLRKWIHPSTKGVLRFFFMDGDALEQQPPD